MVLPRLIHVSFFLKGEVQHKLPVPWFLVYIVYVLFFFGKHRLCLFSWTPRILLLSSLGLEVRELCSLLRENFLEGNLPYSGNWWRNVPIREASHGEARMSLVPWSFGQERIIYLHALEKVLPVSLQMSIGLIVFSSWRRNVKWHLGISASVRFWEFTLISITKSFLYLWLFQNI